MNLEKSRIQDKEKCIVFLLVRTNSKRLPKKCLMKINGKFLIILLAERIKKISKIDDVVICTTKSKSDDKLVQILEENNFNYFRGPVFDINKRLFLAAKKFNVNKFIVVEGDDIFCDSKLISKTCEKFQNVNYDLIKWENFPIGSTPLGISLKILRKIIEKENSKRIETGWHTLIEKSDGEKVILKPREKKLDRPELRLTLDYIEDFQLIKKLYSLIPENFSLKHIINIIDKNPNLVDINKEINEKWKANWVKKRKEQSK